jgi:hypothetical protein
MRVMGYTKRWSKLQKEVHTTFRFTRKDRDWETGEYVQEVYHPRSKNREIMNPKALIIEKTPKWWYEITDTEAIEDGFVDAQDMVTWLIEAYGQDRVNKERVNKLKIKIIKE